MTSGGKNFKMISLRTNLPKFVQFKEY